jgi:hypothetical protein
MPGLISPPGLATSIMTLNSYPVKLWNLKAVEKYLDCGNPKCGFARIRCPDCGT